MLDTVPITPILLFDSIFLPQSRREVSAGRERGEAVVLHSQVLEPAEPLKGLTVDGGEAAAADIQTVQLFQMREGVLGDLRNEVVLQREPHEMLGVLVGEQRHGLQGVVGQVQGDQVG